MFTPMELNEFEQELQRISDEYSRELNEQTRVAQSAELGRQYGMEQFKSILNCFYQLDGKTVGGFLCRFDIADNTFHYGDSRTTFQYTLQPQTDLPEGRIRIDTAPNQSNSTSQTVTLWPRVDDLLGGFHWEGLFPDKKRLNSHEVAAWVIGRLNGIEKQRYLKVG